MHSPTELLCHSDSNFEHKREVKKLEGTSINSILLQMINIVLVHIFTEVNKVCNVHDHHHI